MDSPVSFNLGDNDVINRLHLNESGSQSLQRYKEALLDEFDRISIYPDPSSLLLKQKIATKYGVTPENVLISNGTDEIILLIALSYLSSGGVSLTTDSTFPGYISSTLAVGGQYSSVPLHNNRVNPQAFEEFSIGSAKIAFLCNPHNPTGTIVSKPEVKSFIDRMNEREIIPIIDEAYIQFAGEKEHSVIYEVANGVNAIILRTFSKAYGLAGLRIGYAIGSTALIQNVERMASILPFRVNRFAQRMALEVLDDSALTDTVSKTRVLINQATIGLQNKNIEVLPSSTNFICYRPNEPVANIIQRANEMNARIRDCTPFGLSGWVRASIASESDLLTLWRINDLN